jgi:hypothetical protein
VRPFSAARKFVYDLRIDRRLGVDEALKAERIIHAATPSIAIGTDLFGVPDSP